MPLNRVLQAYDRDEAMGGTLRQQAKTPPAELDCVALSPVGKTAIPPRPWSYGNYLLAGQAAALAALDGGGKSAMAVAIGLAMVTGRPLLGEHVWRTGPVAVVSYEDDLDEWHRRIAAACEHYGVDYHTALNSIRFIQRTRDRIVFAGMHDGVPTYPDGDNIITTLLEMRAALLIVDPFNHAHTFDDGNSNAAMAKVAAEMNRIAQESTATVLVLHHLRKGSTGQPDDMMGATSLRATFRSSRILARMTPEEGKALGVDQEVWRYSRISGSKENYAPPPDKATWYRLETIELNNATPEYPDGDAVGVTTTWQPPALFAGVGGAELATIFAAIRAGCGDGEFYAPRRQAAKRWVGQAIMVVTGQAPEHAARIVRQWIENGVLVVEKYTSPTRRVHVERVVLNETKVGAIIDQTRVYTAPGDL